jgi:hypothetical protein
MNLTELLTHTYAKLDDNNLFFEPAAVLSNGINPAMRLITYSKPALLTRRVPATVTGEIATLDLRTVAPRSWQLARVVLGDVTTEDPAVSGTEYRKLDPTTLESIQWQRDWFNRRGQVTRYWRWGDHWLGFWKRPIVSTTVTLIFRAIPLAFTTDDQFVNPSPEPELPAAWHPLIPDIAMALLIIKEGTVQTEKAQQILTQTFGQEQMKGVRRAIRLAQTAAAVPTP